MRIKTMVYDELSGNFDHECTVESSMEYSSLKGSEATQYHYRRVVGELQAQIAAIEALGFCEWAHISVSIAQGKAEVSGEIITRHQTTHKVALTAAALIEARAKSVAKIYPQCATKLTFDLDRVIQRK
ncbi:hypothetical protein A2765_04750 [Candidatus Kaiserbacteria bacterium RIFCSPHIGHO2_01_FULL_56_24]|uniref:Uncharacterized protein n=1 Tax=Candidatus Kaiserbacteria bacterium RIFCSPHIGHO2_01_FULL_56_24 TaxID=1798487 RepID=A0A1F6DEL6_9BACT|nr:MAG: hypothetical protein A2765_04750 [Candidatus Kaiserbacteria bacterium RIFCSPHIGHO2_01_FULL_56_24]